MDLKDVVTVRRGSAFPQMPCVLPGSTARPGGSHEGNPRRDPRLRQPARGLRRAAAAGVLPGGHPAPGRGAHVRRPRHPRPGPPQVPARGGGAGPRARPGRGPGRRHGQRGQLQHRVELHLLAGLHLRLPAPLRQALRAHRAARPAVPRGRLGPGGRGAAHRPRRERLEARRRGRRALPVGRAGELRRPQRHDDGPGAAHLGLRDQLRRPRRAGPGQDQPADAQAQAPHLGGGRHAGPGELHRLPAAGLAQRRRHEAGRQRAHLGRQRRPRRLRHPVRAGRRRDPDLRRLQRARRPTSAGRWAPS